MPNVLDVDKELRKVLSGIEFRAASRAYWATMSLWSMYAIGTGVCHCGEDIEDHSGWDNHSPVEIYVDKSWDPRGRENDRAYGT